MRGPYIGSVTLPNKLWGAESKHMHRRSPIDDNRQLTGSSGYLNAAYSLAPPRRKVLKNVKPDR
jgi:hypothetical protein